MRIIGITGGIGAGKSTVLKVLQQDYGAYIVEADRVAHSLMMPGCATYKEIIDAFSEEILDETGAIDRAKLSSVVFGDSKKLNILNQIVHPAVKQWIQTEITKHQKTGNTQYFVIEAALLIEDGYTTICDEIWYIYAPEELRIQRLMTSRGYSRDKCESVIRNQSSDAFYRDNCSYLVENGLELENTKKQIDELLMNH